MIPSLNQPPNQTDILLNKPEWYFNPKQFKATTREHLFRSVFSLIIDFNHHPHHRINRSDFNVIIPLNLNQLKFIQSHDSVRFRLSKDEFTRSSYRHWFSFKYQLGIINIKTKAKEGIRLPDPSANPVHRYFLSIPLSL